jgi:ribonuclease Z
MPAEAVGMTATVRTTSDPQGEARQVLAAGGRLLLFGATDSGKSTTAAGAAAACGAAMIGADPGSPAFGPPGAAVRATYVNGGWCTEDIEGLCTLDAGHHRVALILAVARLVARAPSGPLALDAPGVTRGLVGADVLVGLAEAAHVDAVLVLAEDARDAAGIPELLARGIAVVLARPLAAARRRPSQERAVARTASWEAYLGNAARLELPRSQVTLVGMPPEQDDAWPGRQAALLDSAGRTVALAEVLAADSRGFALRCPSVAADKPASLLVRDAQRAADGLLRTRARKLPPPPAPQALEERIGHRHDDEGDRQ